MYEDIEDVNHSFLTLLKYAYIDFPSNVNIEVNGNKVDVQNPFSHIIEYVQADESMTIKGENERYRFWIITQSKLDCILS